MPSTHQPRSAGWPVADAVDLNDLETPVAVLAESSLLHNARWLREFCDAHGFLAAPHAKTSLSPELCALQLAEGAWGLTTASAAQARTVFGMGTDRVLIATEVIDAVPLRDLMTDVVAGPGRELVIFVDSVRGIQALESAARDAGADSARVGVLIEVGHRGGRTGVREQADAVELAEQVDASSRITLRGVGGYEGTIASTRTAQSDAAVDAYLRNVVQLATVLRERGLVDDRQVISVGGSMYLDRVAVALSPVVASGATVLVRSGCYITHDHGLYDAAARVTPSLPPLRPALEVWSRVVSQPEPGLAILNAGRRHVSHDSGLPVPLRLMRAGDGSDVDASSTSVTALSDHHAFLRFPENLDVQVGDIISLGISHPCTTFDKWNQLVVLDDDRRKVGLCNILL